jgi:branched-chain amino acid transport system permease protein
MRRDGLRRWTLPAAIALSVAVAPLVAPNPYVVRIMAQAGIAVLVATGLNLVFGYAGQVSLGHAAFYGVGAYTSAVLTAKLGWHPLAGIAGAAVVTAATAYVIAVPTLRLKGHYLAMATLGLNEIVTILLVEWAWLTGGPSGFRDIPRLRLAGLVFESHTMSYYLVWAFALLGMLVARNLVSSRQGRALRALHDADVAAAACAVDVARAKVRIFVISAVYAGVAGALYAHFVTFISPPTFSVAASIGFLVMVVLGGMGTLAGPVVGALILTFGPEYLRAYQDYTLMVYGALLVATMVFVPRGLASLGLRQRRPS